MRQFRRTVLLAGAALVSLGVVAGCSSQAAAPPIVGSQAPAPGSQDGVRSISDTDFDQLALAVTTAQLQLAELAQQPTQDASSAVVALAADTTKVLTPQAAELQQQLVTAGDAAVSAHHHAAVEESAITALGGLTGSAFDARWARAMLVLNDQIIAAAVNELNVGEDKKSREFARARIDQASAQNGALKQIARAG